ncbi:hypothetical protein F4775DRAFT_590269 [Biscogniauxia sp. FL1348]|nr:hypothetical protein F4775DRAFT_590269 [Biscogniauxia sp. FL1348]
MVRLDSRRWLITASPQGPSIGVPLLCSIVLHTDPQELQTQAAEITSGLRPAAAAAAAAAAAVATAAEAETMRY